MHSIKWWFGGDVNCGHTKRNNNKMHYTETTIGLEEKEEEG